MSILETIQQHIGPAQVQQISQQLGIDQSTAEQAVQTAVPHIATAVASQGQQGSGAAGLLGGLGGMLGGAGSPASGGLEGMLGSLLGHRTDAVGQQVQQATGLGADKTQQLLTMLAPMVLSALAHHNQQAGAQGDTGATPGGLGGMLGNILGR